MAIARVALDVPLPTLFDYCCEDVRIADIGRRVLVPFGRRRVIGVIVELDDSSKVGVSRLKSVISVSRDLPAIPADILQLLKFCADYYHHPLGETILNALPSRLRATTALRFTEVKHYRLTATGRNLDVAALPRHATQQRRVLEALQGGSRSHAELMALSRRAPAIIASFINAGWIEELAAPRSAPITPTPPPSLTQEQHAAVTRLVAGNQFEVFLLFGITGSGKTEVYLHATEVYLARHKQVLILVPEINLTPQFEKQFAARFPDTTLVSLHSGLTPNERLKNWLAAATGEAQVVLGTRLAVFSPLPKLGLIIIDEEHDSSFKQQEGLRYHARDAAIVRARWANIPIVLGSATPALETYHNARLARYSLLKLSGRAVARAQLPDIRIIDLRGEQVMRGFSPTLLDALKKRVALKEQSLIFLNRRGYAPVLVCYQCGWQAGCSRCASRLVAHKSENRLRCHHCGLSSAIPSSCPSCGNLDLTLLGQATQRLEATLSEFFPHANILRVDSDSARAKGKLHSLLHHANQADIDILVGTQILAKGHDFKRLTLVGVVDIDSMLYSPDFRAAERLFTQLVQVGGRAGRADKAGEVLIQTCVPHHAIFESLRNQDYGRFAELELANRQAAGFPPFCYQALVRSEAISPEKALAFLQRAFSIATTLKFPVTLFDPVAATLPRIAGKYRAQLLVQAKSRKTLQAFLARWVEELRLLKEQQVRWSLDVDPLDI